MHINHRRGETRASASRKSPRFHADHAGRVGKQMRNEEFRSDVKRALARDPSGESLPRWVFWNWYP